MMNRYQNFIKPWLVVVCRETFWQIVESFKSQSDAEGYMRALKVFAPVDWDLKVVYRGSGRTNAKAS